MQYKNFINSKRKALIIVVLALLLVGSGIWLWRHQSTLSSDVLINPPESTDGINYSPPTEEEKQQASDRKDEIVNEQNTPAPIPGAEKKSVTLTIVDASQYGQTIEVRAFVSGVVEADGTCTYTFTHGSQTFTKRASAIADASTTRCPNLEVSRTDFANAGTWNIKVSYASASSEGSASGTIEVQ